MPKFEFSNATSFLGQYCCTKDQIKMSTHYDLAERQLQNTFIHEMIHQWQWHTFYKVDHGETFKRKAFLINRDGWNIQRCSSINGVGVADGKETGKELQSYTYLFTWTTDKGEKLFRHARPTCIAKLKESTKGNDFYNDLKLYKVAYTTALKRNYREAVSSLGGYEYWRSKNLVDDLIKHGVRIAV